MIPRKLLNPIFERLGNGKALIILGPRQSGKTTLLNMIAREASVPFLLLDCDEPDIRKLLETPTSTALKNLIGKNKLVMIDEAQRIKNIGLTLKLIIDKIKWVKLVVTGSSALELADEINEPLTGRKIEYFLLPISVEEMLDYHGGLEEKRLLSTRLIYGMYPEILNNPGNENEILRNDIGALWENFLVSEKRKYNSNHQIHANTYFWRTRQQQEIDYIEERDGKLCACEFKWNVKKNSEISKNIYPGISAT